MSVDPNGASLHHGFWQNYGQRPGQGGRKLLIETRIPDALSVDPDPGCPFLGPGSRMPLPWRRPNWYLVPGQGGQRDLPATLGQISPDT